MSKLPFIMQVDKNTHKSSFQSASRIDEVTMLGALPMPIDIENGIRIEMATRITEVAKETTDDN